jgi:hypothetical protein
MMYRLIPVGPQQPEVAWIETDDVSLGGYFYDHLCASDGRVVGVRYWLDSEIDIDAHPVYKEFASDERLKFNKDGGYVDILLDEKESATFKAGELTVETVQDFGGDSAIRAGNRFGIAFSL